MSIAAADDHRLGRRGAAGDHLDLPGDMLTDIFAQIEKGAYRDQARRILHTGVSVLPKLRERRRRTARRRFAFTGNKFEFRAVGSNIDRVSQPLSEPRVAESLDALADGLEGRVRQARSSTMCLKIPRDEGATSAISSACRTAPSSSVASASSDRLPRGSDRMLGNAIDDRAHRAELELVP